jgi:ABC-type lipoprotein release transport system permease subunit
VTGFRLALRLAWRNLGRNRRRSLITGAAIAFALFFAVIMRSLQLGVYNHMVATVVGSMSGYVQVSDTAYWPSQNLDYAMFEDPEWLDGLRANSDVASANPRLQGFSLVTAGERSGVAQWIGLSPEEAEAPQWQARLASGSWNAAPGSVWLGKRLAEQLRVAVGDSVVALGQGYQGSMAGAAWVVAGTLNLGNPELEKRSAVLTLADAQDFSGAYGMWSYVQVTPRRVELSADPTAELAAKHPLEGAHFLGWQTRMPELIQAIQADSAGGKVILFILYVVIGFGLLGTMIMLANERQREFAMQLAMGMRRGILAGTVFIEVLLLSLSGAVAGGILGRVAVLILDRYPLRLQGDVAAAMEQQGWEPILPPSLDPAITLTHAGIIVLIALLAAAWPLRTVFKTSPVHR